MPALPRYLALTNALGACITLGVFLLGAWFSPFPTALLTGVLVLSPAHVLFIATAACEPFDWCSISTLLWVLALNAIVFSVIGAGSWFALRHGPLVRVGLLSLLVGVMAMWLRVWL
jgi:hypothetical protein